MEHFKHLIISCPECMNFPFLQIILNINDNHLLFYKCHHNDFNFITFDNFLKLFVKSEFCHLCKGKWNEFCKFCKTYFCRDDILFHLISSKHISHKNNFCEHQKSKFYYCIKCNMKLCKNCKNDIHGAHRIINDKELKYIFKTLSDFCNNYILLKIDNNIKNQMFVQFLLKIIKIFKDYIENNLWLKEIFYFLLNCHTSIINYLCESQNDIFR